MKVQLLLWRPRHIGDTETTEGPRRTVAGMRWNYLSQSISEHSRAFPARESKCCHIPPWKISCVLWVAAVENWAGKPFWSPEDYEWVQDIGRWVFYRVEAWFCSAVRITAPWFFPLEISKHITYFGLCRSSQLRDFEFGQVWWSTPLVPGLRKRRQEELCGPGQPGLHEY